MQKGRGSLVVAGGWYSPHWIQPNVPGGTTISQSFNIYFEQKLSNLSIVTKKYCWLNYRLLIFTGIFMIVKTIGTCQKENKKIF